jgi:hypothetical protein
MVEDTYNMLVLTHRKISSPGHVFKSVNQDSEYQDTYTFEKHMEGQWTTLHMDGYKSFETLLEVIRDFSEQHYTICWDV